MANNEQKVKRDKKSDKPGFGARIKNFFSGLKAELKRVIWPDRKKLKINTATVLVIILAAALMIFVFDSLVSLLLDKTGFYHGKNRPIDLPVETQIQTQIGETTVANAGDAAQTTAEAAPTTAETTK